MNTLRVRAFLGRNHIRILAVALALYCLTGCTVRGRAAVSAAANAAKPIAGGSDLSHLLLALVGLGIVGVGLSVAGLVWLPFKRACLAGAAGFASVLALALTVKTIQPYLGVIVALGALALLAGIGWAVWKLVKGGKLAADYAKAMASAPDDAAAAAVDAQHAVTWARQGMTSVLAHYGIVVPTPSAPAAKPAA